MRKNNSTNLNPQFTFAEFVIAPSNSFAHAAALAVSQQPGVAYTPLLIYGPEGTGKTHLMQAIGHRVLQTTKKTVSFVTSASLLNEYVDSIQNRKITAFRKKYRGVDVLLVDDIHFLAHKPRLQVEVCQVFNALYAAHKQIVMTSANPDSKIIGLVQNLVSRFEWGLVTEIEQPDFDTRLVILRRKHWRISRL